MKKHIYLGTIVMSGVLLVACSGTSAANEFIESNITNKASASEVEDEISTEEKYNYEDDKYELNEKEYLMVSEQIYEEMVRYNELSTETVAEAFGDFFSREDVTAFGYEYLDAMNLTQSFYREVMPPEDYEDHHLELATLSLDNAKAMKELYDGFDTSDITTISNADRAIRDLNEEMQDDKWKNE